ncbi:MAG TPA: UDP-N-acetylmuramoyl-tripeptide--D-alanyl-D-alanine ligase [Candidatus Kaiserbacteria bacterium]|nr:UDP-N-acetylmuramoyl-tripeptide--D-alanyl-D-alanine ligase [Candidatus Kaiserbacteria bacterium]
MKSIFKKIVVLIIQWEAVFVLKKYKPKIVAVTGSVGKTSTKDAIFTVMSAKFFVRKSEKSFNSEIGVPLTILGCSNAWNNPILWVKNIIEGFMLIVLKNHYPKWLVLEVGADRPGDIESIAKWLKPDVVVLTALPDVPVHIEYFDSLEEIIKEKEYLLGALKEDGILILNNDDEKVRAFKQKYKRTTVTFGFNDGATFKASHDISDINLKQVSFRIDSNGSSVPVFIHKTLGRQHIYPAIAAFSVGSSQGLDMASMAEAYENHEIPSGRMKIIDGINKSTIIDDSYNSSPAAVKEALVTLRDIKASDINSGRKFAVLGDMMELGTYSVGEHKKVGDLVAESADKLITVGIRARDISQSAEENGMEKRNIFHFEDSIKAGKELAQMLESGDIALIKGSQSVRMERIVKEVMANPEDAEKLLVRQDKEWLSR